MGLTSVSVGSLHGSRFPRKLRSYKINYPLYFIASLAACPRRCGRFASSVSLRVSLRAQLYCRDSHEIRKSCSLPMTRRLVEDLICYIDTSFSPPLCIPIRLRPSGLSQTCTNLYFLTLFSINPMRNYRVFPLFHSAFIFEDSAFIILDYII